MTETLSVVIPAYNARDHIGGSIEALALALQNAPAFVPELILVDDGSTDGTADVGMAAARDRIPLRVITQSNRGRFEARRTGLGAATSDWVLFLDSRVLLTPSALAFVAERIDQGAEVWNGHVNVMDDGHPFGVFWRLLAELAWPAYFDDPRDLSYGVDEFDRYPKGTTCFLARRDLLDAAISAFRSRYRDIRSANDDTPLIRWIATRARIHLSPRFACSYAPRTSLGGFFKHSVHRGSVFLDGHARPESRYFLGIAAFFPISASLAAAAVRRPVVAPVALATIGVAAAGYTAARNRSRGEAAAMLVATPIYATGHAIGMWRGLLMSARDRLRS